MLRAIYDNKSRGEYDFGTVDRNGYGLRMQITGLSGYYTLRSQANNHIINSSLPAPEFIDSMEHPKLEYNGYRSEAGTSIVIKLDPGKLGTIDLKASAEKYIYGTRMPVFYNGKRIGYTFLEIMEAAHRLNGENVYELSDEEKEEYDKTFPNAKGQYPKIVITVVPLNSNEYQVIPNLSGIYVKYNVIFNNPPQWQVMDQTYTISTSSSLSNKAKYFHLYTEHAKKNSGISFETFERSLKIYSKKKVDALKQALDQFTSCPSAEELGDVWIPFAKKENISTIWQIFVDEVQNASMTIELSKRFNATLVTLTNSARDYVVCVYQGVYTGILGMAINEGNFDATFFLDNELQPVVDIGRTKVSSLPLEALMTIIGIIYHPDFYCSIRLTPDLLKSISSITLSGWRYFHDSRSGKWVLKTQNKLILKIQEFLQTPFGIQEQLHSIVEEKDKYSLKLAGDTDGLKILYKFISAYFQDLYDMKIYYEDGQSIVFTKKENIRYDCSFDKFPPMMFCKAGSDKSRKYLCCGSSNLRRGITLDHPFAQWLIENAIKIESHFPRQFQQIVYSLCNDDAPEIIKTVSEFCWQITRLNVCYGIDVASLRELTNNDFWYPYS